MRLNYDFATFGDALVGADRRELGLNCVPAQSWARGEVQDWNVVGECLGDTASGVLRTGTALRDYHAKLFAIIDAAEPICRHDRAALLPEHHGADALLGYCFDELVGGETRDPLHAFQLQRVGYGLYDIHNVPLRGFMPLLTNPSPIELG